MQDFEELINMIDLEAAHTGSQDEIPITTNCLPQFNLPNNCFLNSKYQDSLSLNQLPCERSSDNEQVLLITPKIHTFQDINQSKNIELKQKPHCNKKHKNSNAIKKVGRIILDNLKYYQLPSKKPNIGVSNMMRMLSKNSKVGRSEVNKRDKFNTFHLKLLISTPERDLSKYNLNTTREILNRHLRSNVHNSQQITEQMKLIYLNTLKCSALRCINSRLAVRLQMAG